MFLKARNFPQNSLTSMESTSSSPAPAVPQQGPEKTEISPSVMIGKALYSLLSTVKNLQQITTYEEVIDGLKAYVWKKQLFDPKNPRTIRCKDDALAVVLGKEEFTISDLKTLLPKWITPIKLSNTSLDGQPGAAENTLNKRKMEESAVTVEQKKMCYGVPEIQKSPTYLLIAPSPSKSENLSDDSKHSIQDDETAFATDTSDTVLDSSDDEYLVHQEDIIVDETFDLEYEVQSDSSEYLISSASSSGSEDFEEVAMDATLLHFSCKGDSDIEFFADDSSDEDIEIPKSDHWKCTKCEFSNRPPMRYCARCWQEREQWFTEKADHPRRRKKGRRKKSLARNETQVSLPKNIQNSQGSSCSEVNSLPSQTSTCSSEPEPNLCIICCAKPATAYIVHGKFIVHQISCYKCARTLQKQKKLCPICRKKITSVLTTHPCFTGVKV